MNMNEERTRQFLQSSPGHRTDRTAQQFQQLPSSSVQTMQEPSLGSEQPLNEQEKKQKQKSGRLGLYCWSAIYNFLDSVAEK